ncbi:MAG TPA: FAD/NAD(P)-binding oxidoreductase [Burkholderiaceae bacterium]|nr:FAD/NAD(P)-binding oxidoreductase [Burkholderiaceae bacterium]
MHHNKPSRSSALAGPVSPARRRALAALGATALTGTAINARAQSRKEKVATKASIVIAGGGAAGLTAASHLAARLNGAKITIIDARREHYYQPGFTLVGGGIKPPSYTVSTTGEYIPKGVEWLQASVAEFDPEASKVVTDTGQTLEYDYLVIATGLVLNYSAIDGMDAGLIGEHGIGGIYNGPEAAALTWKLMSHFADTGGRGVFLRPNTEMKCAGAPLKYTFITEDHLQRRGNRGKAELVYNANNQALFSVPIVSEKTRMLFEERNIQALYDRVLTAIDPGSKRLTFTTPNGTEEQDYDFVHVIPPMQAPDAILDSPLPWQTGKWQPEGWMEVDRGSLRHVRYQNIFGVGDIAGVPKGKTAASVKWQVPVAVAHIVADLAGQPTDALYEGYTSCPLITRLGQAMLIEFDYNDNLTPSFPGIIAPLEELWISWVMKTMALKPTYISMLRGNA